MCISGVLIFGYELFLEKAISDMVISSARSSPIVQIIDYIIVGITYVSKAFVALVGVGLINGITGQGFKVRIRSPGEK